MPEYADYICVFLNQRLGEFGTISITHLIIITVLVVDRLVMFVFLCDDLFKQVKGSRVRMHSSVQILNSGSEQVLFSLMTLIAFNIHPIILGFGSN